MSQCSVGYRGYLSNGQGKGAGKLRRGFTLIQLVVSLGVLSMVATMLFNAFSDGRSTARRTQCDARLKTIALALDAFRQEKNKYPTSLQELNEKHYLHEESALHCPMDVREDGTYGDFYAIRAVQDRGDLPILVCPFHESQGNAGEQVFKGGYTKQFLVRPAKLEAASGAMILRPGQSAVTAVAGIALRGGDRIQTSEGGSAVIRFADNSSCELGGAADVTVLQSFVASNAGSTLYTIVRQGLGTVMYKVHHGSKFDVATPTATAGALGTKFEITVFPNGTGSLSVIESKVYVSAQQGYAEVATGRTVPLDVKPARAVALNPNALAPSSTSTPTPAPTSIPTPAPTSTPGSGGNDGDKDGDDDHDNGSGNNDKPNKP
ncbi:MAG TPA: FecR domain-containing protein [Abditibacteriaceae bacterium]